MFGRTAAWVALLCVIGSVAVAGEARVLSGRQQQFVNQFRSHGQRSRALPIRAQRPTWPPTRLFRQPPVARTTSAGRAGRFGDAFMVDTSMVPTPGWDVFCFSCGAASNGDGWRVFWADDHALSVFTSGIGSDGSVTDAVGNRVGNEVYSTQGEVTRAIVGTGSGFTAVWTAGDNRSIWSARLDSAGNVLDSLLVHDSDKGQILPAIAFDGDSTCLVAWMDNVMDQKGGIYAARITADGRLLDPVPFQVSKDSTKEEGLPSIAFGHGVYLVAWMAVDSLGTTATAKATRVSAGGVVLDTAIFLRHDPGMLQMAPNVAFGDTCFLATWSEGLQQPDIFAARISASGNLMDTSAIQLCSDPDLDMFSSIGFDGTNYLVMWEEDDTTYPSGSLCGRRLTADGVALDSVFIRPRPRNYVCQWPNVSADRHNFLVACNYWDTLTLEMGVCCLRISPQGAVLDSGIFLPMGADGQYEPSGAFDGTNFLAVWPEDHGQFAALSAARITADGTVLDPVGFPVDTAPTYKSNPQTAFGDSVYLVAWADQRDVTGADIYCARIDMDGHVLDPGGIVVCDESLDQDYPDISFDGANFLVAWHDNRSNMRGNIYAARVSPAGVVLDPNGFAVAVSDSFDDAAPAVCFNGADHLVVWQGYSYNTVDTSIYGALVSTAGVVTRPRFRIGFAAGQSQAEPSVARGSASSLVAWVNLDDGAVHAARVRANGTVLDTNALFVNKSSLYNEFPHVTSDAAGFRVLWDDWGTSGDTTRFSVARIDTAGNLIRSDPWFAVEGYIDGADAVYGSGPDLLLLFSGWTGAAYGRRYSAYRLWGRLGDVPGIAQSSGQETKRVASGASIVRGVLVLGAVGSRQNAGYRAELLDISGRKAMNLQCGANDVSRLAPGVYFVRDAQAQKVRKVVIQR